MKFIKANPKSWKVYKNKNGFEDYVPSWNQDMKNGSENFVFEATLKPDSFYRGRSAAGFKFKDADEGTSFTMRIACTEELLKQLALGKVKVVNEGFKANYTFVKQGANYSIAIYEEGD